MVNHPNRSTQKLNAKELEALSEMVARTSLVTVINGLATLCRCIGIASNVNDWQFASHGLEALADTHPYIKEVSKP